MKDKRRGRDEARSRLGCDDVLPPHANLFWCLDEELGGRIMDGVSARFLFGDTMNLLLSGLGVLMVMIGLALIHPGLALIVCGCYFLIVGGDR